MAAKILKQNGEPFSYEGREIPLNLHVTCYQLETANLKYVELFADLQNRLDQTKHKKDGSRSLRFAPGAVLN